MQAACPPTATSGPCGTRAVASTFRTRTTGRRCGGCPRRPALIVHLEAGDARATVDAEAGGRIASLEIAGLEILLPRRDDPLRWGCYPMAPWAGRVRRGLFRFEGRTHSLPITFPPHAIHGTTLDRAWTLERDGRLSISLGDDWPFPGRAVQEIALEPDRLRLRLEVHAESAPFPASVGWHPWFRRRLARGGAARLTFGPGRMYRRDEDGIPTGDLIAPSPGPWDDCFTDLAREPEITWPGALRLCLHSSATHWVVYDEPAHALCVEPQTGPPDALNLAPWVVRPGRPLLASAELSWSALSGND